MTYSSSFGASSHPPHSRQMSFSKHADMPRPRSTALIPTALAGYTVPAARRQGPMTSSRHFSTPMISRCDTTQDVTKHKTKARTTSDSDTYTYGLPNSYRPRSFQNSATPGCVESATKANSVKDALSQQGAFYVSFLRARDHDEPSFSAAINAFTAHPHAAGKSTQIANRIAAVSMGARP